MIRRFRLLLIVLCLVPAVVACDYSGVAAQTVLADGESFLALVAADAAAGRITDEQALLFRFQYGFAPTELPERYRVAGFSPLRCATDLVGQYYRVRERLSRSTVDAIDAWLAPGGPKLQHVSPGGRFVFTYETTGVDAVPAADVAPANGVPDYVDMVAAAFDTSWAVLTDSLGFTAPPLINGTYAVSFESMQFYGYTTAVNMITGQTRIVMHNTYIGFPVNQDPAGSVVGAAKVTAAHEFKHATQFAATRWAEGGWGELDATWSEDIVFDEVNDYYNYLTGESPTRHPEIPLDGGSTTTGSYEDSVWQIWLAETWGVGVIQDFWTRRAGLPGETVMATYAAVLADRGVSLREGWAMFTAWNAAVGARAVPGLGYEEAASYPEGPVLDTAMSYPFSTAGGVERLAAGQVRLDGFSDTSTELLRIDFNGADNAGALTLAIQVTRRDGTGLIEVVPLDAANDALHLLSVPVREILRAMAVVGNASTFGLAASWNLALDLVPIPAVPLALADRAAVAVELDAGTTVQQTVRLTNTGEQGSLLQFGARLWATDPDSVSGAGVVARRDKSIAGSTFTCARASYLPGQLLNLDFTLTNNTSDDEWLTDAGLDFPAGVAVLVASDFVGGSLGVLAANDSLGDGVAVAWHGTFGAQNYGVVRAGEAAFGTVQVQIDPMFSGDLAIDWILGGDEFGSAPHQVAGSIVLAEDSPVLTLQAPNGGESFAVGDSVAVVWSTGGLLATVDLDLSRDGGATWTTLLADAANDGSEDLVFGGPAAYDCLLRVRESGGGTADVSDTTFQVFAEPEWVQVDPAAGALLCSDYSDLTLTVDGTALAVGWHRAWLVVENNGPGPRLVLPIEVTVTADPATVGESRLFAVRGARPNPFNPRTTIAFELPTAAATVVDVLDLRGCLVRRLQYGHLAAGSHARTWDGRDDAGRGVSAGVYLVRVRSGGFVGTTKVLLAK